MDGKTWKQIDLQQSEGTNVDSRDGSHVFCLKNCENQRMTPMSIFFFFALSLFTILFFGGGGLFWFLFLVDVVMSI